MKSYNNLYDKFLSDENIRLAIKNVCKHKTKRKRFRLLKENPDKYIPWIRKEAENFTNDEHTPIVIYDGITRKQRTIIVPSFKEQIVHHMIVNILKPIFLKSFYEHSYGSIPNKGAHLAKKNIERYIRKHPNDCKNFLKMDVKKYFDSIPHQTMKAKLTKLIRDRKFLNILFTVIDVVPTGIPLGFYTSQWIANWYLTGLDHFIKEQLHAKCYWRYMDDMVIGANNTEQLHRFRISIGSYLIGIGLELKSNYQVFRFVYKEEVCFINGKRRVKRYGRDIDFMGFRFFNNRTILRKSILTKSIRKARKIAKKGRPTIYDVRQMLSYLGWYNATDTYNAYINNIKPIVDFGKYKKKVSKHDRRQNHGKVA